MVKKVPGVRGDEFVWLQVLVAVVAPPADPVVTLRTDGSTQVFLERKESIFLER